MTILIVTETSHDDQPAALAAFTAEADTSRIGPLSLVAEFDLALAEHLGVADPAPHVQLLTLLNRLQSAGALSVRPSGDGTNQTWRWLPEPRTTAQASFVSQSPQTARALEARLASWFSAHNQATPALTHAMASGDWPTVVDVIEAVAWRLFFDEPLALARALVSIPFEELQDRPMALAIRHTWPVPPLDPATMPAPELLSTAEQQQVGSGDQARRAIETDRALSIMYRVKGRYRQALAYGNEMIALMRIGHAAGIEGVDELMSGGLLQVAITDVACGNYQTAIDKLLEADRFASVSERQFIAGDVAGRLAAIYALRGELTEAQRWLQTAVALPAGAGPAVTLIQSAITIGQVLVAISSLDAELAAGALEQLRPSPVNDDWWAQVLHARVCFALGWGDRLEVLAAVRQAREGRSGYAEMLQNDAVAPALLAAAEANLLGSLGRGSQAWAILNYNATRHPVLDVARARLALLTGDPATALTITDSIVPADPAIALDRTVLRAAALLRLDRRDDAAHALTSAIMQAVGNRFAFAQISRSDLLELIELTPAASTTLTPEVLALLPDIYPTNVSLLELTTQEQLILNGLAAGKGLADLATELHLAESTIKNHQRRLYRKLEVKSREAALATAGELGLLGWPQWHRPGLG